MSAITETLEATAAAGTVRSYAAQAATSPLAPFAIHRREPRPTDVAIDILYCGVCHSDLHTARNEWHGTIYPVRARPRDRRPRHRRSARDVTKFKVGDLAAVGCMVDSCRTCASCQARPRAVLRERLRPSPTTAPTSTSAA